MCADPVMPVALLRSMRDEALRAVEAESNPARFRDEEGTLKRYPSLTRSALTAPIREPRASGVPAPETEQIPGRMRLIETPRLQDDEALPVL